jgi:annexin A7/11
MTQLRKAYEAQTGESLVHVVTKDTGGWLEFGLRGLVLGPLAFDVWLVHHAGHGVTANEDLLTEVLVGRTNEDLEMLKFEYRREFGKDLAHVVRAELHHHTRQMFNMVLAVTLPSWVELMIGRP